MTLPTKSQPVWPLWILGATLLMLLGLALIYLINPSGLVFAPGTVIHSL